MNVLLVFSRMELPSSISKSPLETSEKMENVNISSYQTEKGKLFKVTMVNQVLTSSVARFIKTIFAFYLY